MSDEAKIHSPEVLEDDHYLELKKPGTPATIQELSALDQKRGVAIIEARSEILQTLRVASIRLTMPNDWTLFRAVDERGETIAAFLGDQGCDRIKKLWSIQIDNISEPVRIEAKDGTFAYQLFGDGKSAVTGECVFQIEGIRYSNERYAEEKPEGIQREVAVRKAARANLDGGITRELAGLKSVPVQELDKAWEGTWKKSSMCARGRGFGSKAERAGAAVRQSEIAEEYQPRCSTCNAVMKFIPAGKTQAGRPYEAFWSCPSREHKYTLKHEQALTEARRMQTEAQPPAPEPGDGQ